jgi:hypothetical protein
VRKVIVIQSDEVRCKKKEGIESESQLCILVDAGNAVREGATGKHRAGELIAIEGR